MLIGPQRRRIATRRTNLSAHRADLSCRTRCPAAADGGENGADHCTGDGQFGELGGDWAGMRATSGAKQKRAISFIFRRGGQVGRAQA